MTTEIDALRAAMRAAQPSQRGNYIEPGQFLLECERAQCKRTLQGTTWKESWIIEFRVVESKDPTKTGTSMSYIEVPTNQGWAERLKSCILALLGSDPAAALTPDANEAYVSIVVALRYDEERVKLGLPENFLKGRRVVCEATAGKSRAGGPVTNKKWAPAPAAQAA